MHLTSTIFTSEQEGSIQRRAYKCSEDILFNNSIYLAMDHRKRHLQTFLSYL